MAEATADSIQGQIAALDSQEGCFSFSEIDKYVVRGVYPEVGMDLIGPLTVTPRGNKYIITL